MTHAPDCPVLGPTLLRSRAVPTSVLLLMAAGITTALSTAVIVAATVRPHGLWYSMALAAHFASLVAGFGAVLTVDWFGLSWAVGERPLRDTLAVASAVQPLIWLGLGGLVASGALLRPDLALTTTRLQLALVLAVALNGVAAIRLHERLTAAGERPGRRLAVAIAASTAVSQTGWWGSMAIGLINAHHGS